MTIENATPRTHMDQADMLSLIGGLYDKLVNDVAARVLGQIEENLDARFAMLLESADFEDKVEACVQTAVDNLDLDDTVMSAVQDLTFEVSVSR
jgi:histidinol dehydrogenase